MEPEDTELYRTLGLDPNSVDVLALSDKDIARAYRKAALKWHPDKNPNDAAASAKFSEVFLAYETLTSATERAKYDAAIRTARERTKRFELLDAGRRQLKEDLYRREKAVGTASRRPVNLDQAALKRMQREIERLRRDGLRQTRAAHQAQPVTRGSASEASRAAEKDGGGGEWAKVPGYARFRSARGHELSFEQFEEAVLSGTFGD